ncbi:MAG TPA: glycosyl transferase [Elusimicrobia bacterium]|nr:glycosyl transferase [Elusimicrobiota bacterium]
MLTTELYNGQGLGNQLWSYVVTRALALDRGLDFGIMRREKFKGGDFMGLDFGKRVEGGSGPEGGPPSSLPRGIINYYVEKDIWHPEHHCDIRDYDPGLPAVPDNTKIEGLFQSEKYIAHRKNEIREWLRVKPAFDCRDFSAENICILNVRGGEYKGNPDLILPRKYWTDAVANMLLVNSRLKFVVITDDVKYAGNLLPEYKAFHFDIGKDYCIVKNARYLILANSSFSFFPAWTSEAVKYVIAPKYWARHNVSDGFWACAFNLYRDWLWQDRDGKLFTFEECESEYADYKVENGLEKFGDKPPSPRRSLLEKYARGILDAASKAKHRLLD